MRSLGKKVFLCYEGIFWGYDTIFGGVGILSSKGVSEKSMKGIRKSEYQTFVKEIKEKIRQSQFKAMQAVNRELISLYSEIGQMIVEKQEALGWGKSVVENLSKDLQNEFSGAKGYSVQNLWYMRQFYLEYKDNKKLQPLVGEISWSKNLVIMGKCKDDFEREFYIQMIKRWRRNTDTRQVLQ